MPFTYLLTLTGRQTGEIDPHGRRRRIMYFDEVTDKQEPSWLAQPDFGFGTGIFGILATFRCFTT